MFGLLNLFGKRPAANSSAEVSDSTVLNTISKLKVQTEFLEKRNKYVETKIGVVRNEILEVRGSNKKKALILLSKMKQMESEVLKNEGVRSIIEKQIAALESSAINKHVADALREGNKVVKNAQKNVNADQIEDLMDDMRETEDAQQTIADAFSRNIQDIYDNTELADELEEMTRGKEPQIKQDVPYMPNAPNNPIPKPNKQEDASTDADEIELNNLRESMLA
jgi:hypothetical protein